jgi:hypothetical protein
VASLLPQHTHSNHPDSTTDPSGSEAGKITGEKQGSGNLADKASRSCSVVFFYTP